MIFRKNQKRPEPPVVPSYYPSGIALTTEKGTFYLGKDGKRYKIQSQHILDSWSFPVIAESTEAALVKYPIALTRLGFRDGSLLHNIADGKLYLVSESRLRHITGPDVLTRLNLNKKDAVTVSDSDIQIMKVGDKIV